ncbi:MAG: peptidase domain-containing ABC transporter [Chitinophagaceae bacterium]
MLYKHHPIRENFLWNNRQMETTNIKGVNPLKRVFSILNLDRKEISAIYFYAILSGFVQLSLPLGIQSIISYVLGGAFSTSLVILIVLVVMAVFFNGFLTINQMSLIEKVQQKLFLRYSLEYANRIPQLDLKSIDQYHLPELVNRFFDTISLQKSLSRLLLEIPAATIQILFGLILLSFYHPVFIAFSVLLVSILSILLYYTSPKGMESSLRESDYKYKIAGWLEELSRVINSFKFSKGTKLHLRKTDDYVKHYLKARTDHFKVLKFQYWTLVGFKVLITAAMLIVGSLLLISQQLNLGQFIAAEIVILLVINSVEKIIIYIEKVYDVLTSIEKLDKVLDKPLDKEGTVTLNPINGVEIRIDNLSFGYNDKISLKDINLQALPGEKIIIDGKQGSGKSTLLRLLTGNYPDFSGKIMLNNLPLQNYHSESLRKHTGILLSNQDIFEGTVLENITMGDQNISINHIMDVAKETGLQNFLDEHQQGFETRLDPFGKRLSKSSIQKILLLRALTGNPKILLLEDPLQGLDEESCSSFRKYITENCKDVTAFIITKDQVIRNNSNKVIDLVEGKMLLK